MILVAQIQCREYNANTYILASLVAIVQLRAYYTSVSAWSQTEFPINNVNVRRILIQARAT